MSTSMDYSKFTAMISVASFSLTLNYYFGNPLGLPLKIPIVSASILPSLSSGGGFELPVLVLGIAVIIFVAWAYLKRAR